MKKLLITTFIGFCILAEIHAQVYTNKEVGKKNEALADSLKKSEYPYFLPIWGAKVVARGYDIPYSAGFGATYITQTSALILDNLMVGFNNGPMYNLDEMVRFNEAEAWASGVSVRPDIWLLPFLNVYGVLGKVNSSTTIDAGVYLPNTDNEWEEVSSFSTTAEFTGSTVFGLGMTPTIGIGGGFMALDMNVAWTDVDALEKPVFTFVFGPRFGKSFKLKKPERNITAWVGGFRLKFTSETAGSLALGDVVNTDEFQVKVDEGIEAIGEKQVAVDDWWAGLSSEEQNNPVNEAKYETANRVLGTAGEIFNAADAALNDEQSATVQYSLDKDVKDKWNFLIGSQFQLNKHWMIRAEYGFLGSRTQFLTGLQYRFRL
jgi:hypothetical protein